VAERLKQSSKKKARPADYFLIDVSNSFTKVAFSSRKKIERADRFETARLTSKVLARYLRRREVGAVVVSSVVPSKNRVIRKAVYGHKTVWVSARISLGITIDYPKPLTIGADRLANAAAVAFLYRTPAIVVDFGTAVTFDIVSENKSYLGGVICPGLEAMTNFLYQRTALLPKLSLREPRRAVGKSTMEAMRSGAIYGYRGLVREIIARISEQEFARKRVKVVGTGGYARLIARKLSLIERVDPHLTLEGLRIVGNLNR
jgi:type III pantothenate kinase